MFLRHFCLINLNFMQKPGDIFLIKIVPEILGERVNQHLAHPVNSGQRGPRLLISIAKAIHDSGKAVPIPMRFGQQASSRLPDMPNAKRKQEPFKRQAPPLINCREQLLRRFLAPAFAIGEAPQSATAIVF